MSSRPRPILVTGAHRSGSTWVGRVLCAADGTGYVHEPFNVDLEFPPVARKPPHWFQYYDDETGADYAPVLRDAIEFRYPRWHNLARVRSRAGLQPVRAARARALKHARAGARAVVKDPIALFSAPWIARTFGADVIVCVRHPAAFAASLKVKDWTFDFNEFLRQPRLLAGPLAPWRADIERLARAPAPIHVQASLLWCCLYGFVDRCREAFPGWIFVRHEDLSRDPVGGFRTICGKVGLAWSAAVGAEVERTSKAEGAAADPLVRDSARNIWTWKERLSAAEIGEVRALTADVGPRFYADADW